MIEKYQYYFPVMSSTNAHIFMKFHKIVKNQQQTLCEELCMRSPLTFLLGEVKLLIIGRFVRRYAHMYPHKI